ncbi:type VI secretion system baseplate subunit TssF [Pseudomonas mosselii]|uniref:Type VI secretion system baseplate subunit TssF n=1 Tax=Pseudomonas mosselii TaxID=78327 RepID=A0ABX9AUT1_9PSED|nr:type VI secretion system baseplate subunit TssF [Pseudomonas mosselii]KXG81977.1 type VI secretion protein [Pseudomonas mosselii]MCU9532751.1 type VI secretion system baseplate subunit TssF [Pseudomonas mosselii]MCU9540158.1 type VI secretion system baseplate subunit TssF [Pseudomonas mosselii]MCU9545891.1 type VI secretion system baseplate subunit TssF [Pseudomonas mosselii]MCU9551718.1 type VI secretion system baseplate subunit TssF [Pseudomonas mosselii]
MSLKDRFGEELRYLRELGEDFARDNPQLSRYLGKDSGDPGVERLLEGFAFLIAKLRLKLEDEVPELTHGMLQLLWPNYLRPLPSATIIQFSPLDASLSQAQIVPRGSRLFSRPVDGVDCEFRTCTEVKLYPFTLGEVGATLTPDSSVIHLQLETQVQRPLNTLGCDSLEFHLGGERSNAQTLYLWLAQYLEHISVTIDGQVRRLPANHLSFSGFGPDEALLPYPRNVFDGYRILQEYLVFPQRFHFFSLAGLDRVWPAHASSTIRIEFHLARPLPGSTRIGPDDFRLFCAPAVNLFVHGAEPIDLSGTADQHRLVPHGLRRDSHEIFSVDRVISTRTSADGSPGEQLRVFQPFESFAHEIEHVQGRTALYYRCRVEQSLLGDGLDHQIAFVRGDESQFIGHMETASIELTCTNRDLPMALGLGDINVINQATAPLIRYRNICLPTRPYRPVLDGQLQWTLISNLSLNYLSLLSAAPLKAVIGAYDFAALHDIQQARTTRKRLDGIGEAHTEPLDWLIKGLPIRGLRTRLRLDQKAFLCEGDLYLFGCVLSHFFALYASINSFHQLEVINTTNNEHYTWPLLTGRQPLI